MLKSLAPMSPAKIRRSAFLIAMLLIAAVGFLTLSPAQAQSANGVYDTDGDRLIEISNLEQLYSMIYDDDGNGRADRDDWIDYYAYGYPLNDGELVCDRSCNGYELARSLDFNEPGSYASGQVNTNWTRGSGFDPNNNFGTTFEGNGHTISNLYMDVTLQTDQENAGLFGNTDSSAVIRDVGLLNVEVTGVSNVGGLVGHNFGQIRYSYVTGTVSGTGDDIGGLVGENDGTISLSYATAEVTGAGANSDRVGGLVGWNGGTITESYASGTVRGDDSVGGLVGFNGGWTSSVTIGIISLSYATGNVTGDEEVGGLAGNSRLFNTNSSGRNWATIRSSYATGSVAGSKYIGGLVGKGGWCSGNCFFTNRDRYLSNITGSYATGTVSGTSDVGGLLGYGQRNRHGAFTSINDSYWNTDVRSNGVGSGGATGAEGKTTTELQAPTGRTGIYAGWSSRNWDFGDSSQYPALKADLDGDGLATAWEFGGQGRAAPPMPPGAATISSVIPGSGSLTVSWSAPPGDASGITAYDLRHILTTADENMDANWTLLDDAWTGTGPLRYEITGLTGGTEYDVQVRAVNSAGDGPWSVTATGTPAGPSATRSFSAAYVEPGGTLTVTITAADYGRVGRVTESLPQDFTYVSSTLPDLQVTEADARTVGFNLLGNASFSYDVTAPDVEGSYSFSGTLTDSERNEYVVGGADTVTVASGNPLVARYDANRNGEIEIDELFSAIDDYFNDVIGIDELFALIDLYFAGSN